jgi:hypothetical protein
MPRRSIAAAAAGLWLSIAPPLAAQAPPGPDLQAACQTHAEIMQMLDQKFAEIPAALGLQSNGHLIQVFASKDGTTWTIVSTRPDGVSCIVALGRHWEALPNPVLEPLA